MRQERPSFDPPPAPAPARPQTPGPEPQPATPQPGGSPAHDAPLSPEHDARVRTRDAEASGEHVLFDEDRVQG
jgi:hypothetical protein